MLNGDTLSPGKVFKIFCKNGNYPVAQGGLFLPKPNATNQYYLFYFLADDVTWTPRYLLYSLVDASGDNGLGEVVEKNQPIFEDIELSEYVVATRHANGRDWWIICPLLNSNVYTRCLLTPDGVQYIGKQAIGSPDPTYWSGQAGFSPDGSVYFKVLIDGARVMDFDRCTGLFSNFRFLPSSPIAGAGGGAVSLNSRFLYTADGTYLNQYDLWATDLEGSKQLIAEYDGFQSPFSTAFYQCGLAPDGKIYLSTGSTNNVLHVIHQPDLPGAACQIEQHGLQLPALTGWYIPNFANYRLGPLDCSTCDTLGLNSLPQAAWRVETDTAAPLAAAFHDLSACADTWLWDFGDGSTTAEQHPSHTYAAPGAYYVCLTVTNVNGSSTYCDTIYVVLTAQDDPTMDRRVEVWPSPFDERLNVAFSARPASPVFWLYDCLGRVVRATPLPYGISELDTGDLNAGIYFWEVTSRGARVRAGRVVKAER